MQRHAEQFHQHRNDRREREAHQDGEPHDIGARRTGQYAGVFDVAGAVMV